MPNSRVSVPGVSEVSELPGVLVVLPGVLFDVPHADNNVNVIKHARINAVILDRRISISSYFLKIFIIQQYNVL